MDISTTCTLKLLLLEMLLGAALLTGCASHYVVTLNNHRQIEAGE